jgi:hypothetical protein
LQSEGQCVRTLLPQSLKEAVEIFGDAALLSPHILSQPGASKPPQEKRFQRPAQPRCAAADCEIGIQVTEADQLILIPKNRQSPGGRARQTFVRPQTCPESYPPTVCARPPHRPDLARGNPLSGVGIKQASPG